MKLFNTQKNMKKNTNRVLCLMAASGLAMSGSAAMAQTSAQNYEDHMESEPGEGVHEEEWYDPTDWWDDDFDGVRGPDVDYELEDNGTDWTDESDGAYVDGYYAVYDGDWYDWDWWDASDSELYNDGYYSGYYDGYTDDEFGYDHMPASSERDNTFGSGYAAGYYDGYYDQHRGFDYDWTYYLYTTPVDSRRADASGERSGDESRERGDRAAEAGTDEMNRRQASKDAREREMTRTRGTVKKIERLKKSKLSSEMKDHRVLRLTFENGKTVVTDFGPKADSGLIEKGDRVTVAGKRVSKNGRKMLDVSRLAVNDEVMWNSKHEDKPQQVSSR